MILISSLVPRPLLAASVSAAAVFRGIDMFHPTLLIDEGDTSLVQNEELRGILNGGHTRDTAVVLRTVGDQHETRVFSTWCPKAIALIGRLKDTLEDRSIHIELKRKTRAEKVARLPRRTIRERCEMLRRQAARWAVDHADIIGDAEPETPEHLHDRAADNWTPLLAIADAAGGAWPERARTAAVTFSGTESDDGSVATQLLFDLRDLFEKHTADRLTSEAVVRALRKMEDRPWPEFCRGGKPITAAAVARLLRPFSIRPKTIRSGKDTGKGYLRADFEDAFGRYLPPEPSHRNNAGISSFLADSEPSQIDPCDGPESREKERNGALVTGVTAPDDPLTDWPPDEPRKEFDL